jgi:transmembrane sensor
MDTGDDHAPPSQNGGDPVGEAVRWQVRLTSGEATEAERRAFADWRRVPEHAAAYAEIDALWDVLGTALTAPAKVVPLPARPRLAGRFAMGVQQMMAAAASLAIIVLTGYQYQHVWQYDHVTQGTERRTVTLADGTVVQLNTGTALDVDYQPGLRRVKLLRGEAFFDVVHNPARRFVVDAGNGDVTVLGTAFSVRRDSDGAQVIVQRGKVRVRSGRDVVDIVPNQSVAYASGHEGPVSTLDAGNALAWSRGRLIFENKPLGEVIASIDRYYPGILILTDRKAAAKRVNAVVDLGRIDEWLDALKGSQGVSAHHLPGVTILS